MRGKSLPQAKRLSTYQMSKMVLISDSMYYNQVEKLKNLIIYLLHSLQEPIKLQMTTQEPNSIMINSKNYKKEILRMKIQRILMLMNQMIQIMLLETSNYPQMVSCYLSLLNNRLKNRFIKLKKSYITINLVKFLIWMQNKKTMKFTNQLK